MRAATSRMDEEEGDTHLTDDRATRSTVSSQEGVKMAETKSPPGSSAIDPARPTEQKHTARNTTDQQENQRTHKSQVEQHRRRLWLIPSLIVLLGAVAAAAFGALGFTTASADHRHKFEMMAAVYPNYVRDLLGEYALVAGFLHQACRHMDLPRGRFLELYQNIKSTGLVDFQSMECLPKVMHEERQHFENESRAYYTEHYPDMTYHGFTGFEYTPEGKHATLNRSIQEFYWPQHYVEPIENNTRALDYDAYSSSTRRGALETALDTQQPALSRRFGHSSYQVLLVHPGYDQDDSGNASSSKNDHRLLVAKLHFHMEDFIARAAHVQESEDHSHHFDHGHTIDGNILLYFFDTTPTASVSRSYLGGVCINHMQNSTNHDDHQHHHDDHTSEDEMDSACVVAKDTLGNVTSGKQFVYQEVVEFGSRQWTIVVFQESNRLFTSQHVFILLGSFIILLSCVCLALWVQTDARKNLKMARYQQVAQQERTQLIVAHAHQKARAERELNDYVAHEVRNPLAAALSAHAFVNAEVCAEPPLATPDSKESVRDDMGIIGNSLHFINDLLRSMLDTSRVSSNEMVIENSPTGLLSDVLEPIHSMLHLRDKKVDLIIACDPPNLIIETDGLRLKQIVLNLARNSSKFVQNGFIRLVAKVLPDNGNMVQILVEDSGPGVPLEKRPQMFSKFQSSLDSLNQGTGIGLSLSKKLVDLMGMELWLDESFDSGIPNCPGARFVIDTNVKPMTNLMIQNDSCCKSDGDFNNVKQEFDEEQGKTLPATPLVINPPIPTSEQEITLPESLKVLFVDDDLILRKLFSRTIRKAAPTWDISEASNGETALKLVQTEQYDVIFMDQYMASVEQQLLGTETTRALRSRGVTNSVICGLSANDVRAGFEEAGAEGFIFKPFPTQPTKLRLELHNLFTAARQQHPERKWPFAGLSDESVQHDVRLPKPSSVSTTEEETSNEIPLNNIA